MKITNLIVINIHNPLNNKWQVIIMKVNFNGKYVNLIITILLIKIVLKV
jgi:hypothetical protein